MTTQMITQPGSRPPAYQNRRHVTMLDASLDFLNLLALAFPFALIGALAMLLTCGVTL